MHPSGSLIKSAIEELRILLNEAALDSKYPDAFIVRSALSTAFSQVFSKANQISTERIFIRLPLTITAGQQYYTLPPCVEQVHCIRKYDEDGRLVWDWRPDSMLSNKGPGWQLEHRTLSLLPIPTEDIDCELWYTPSAHINMHYATDGSVTTSTAPTSFTLSASPALGLLGKGENEYVGAVLRSLDSTHAERIISSYTNSTRVVGLRTALPNLSGTASRTYEIVPAGLGPFWAATVSLAAIRLGIGRKIDGSHRQGLIEQHRGDLKHLRDTLGAMSARFARRFERGSMDDEGNSVMFEKSP